MIRAFLSGAIALALLFPAAFPASAASLPSWVSEPPRNTTYLTMVGKSPAVETEVSARTEAIKDAMGQLNLMIGFGDHDAEAKKAFNRNLVQVLMEEKTSGPGIEETHREDLGGGKVRVYILLRYPRAMLAAAKVKAARPTPAKVTLKDAAERLAEHLEHHALTNPVVGGLAVQGFREEVDGRRHKLANLLESELTKAIGRLEGRPFRLDAPGKAAFWVTGTYRLSDDRKGLLVTAQLMDARLRSVVWTSPEVSVTAADLSELLPPAPPVAKATPTAASKAPQRERSSQQKVNRPRIMVVLPETHISRPAPDPAGETEIVRQLLAAGFKLVDQTQSKKIRDNEREFQRMQGDLSKMAALGREYGAEVIVFGEAFSETVGREGNGVRVMARVEARAVRCDTSEILVAHGLEAEASEGSELVAAKKALRLAGAQVGEYFVQQLNARWSQEAAKGRTLEVLISNITYPQLSQLRGVVENRIEGVQAFHQRHFESNLARFEVDYAGDVQDLVDALVGQKVGEKRLELTKLTGAKVELKLR